MALRVLESTPSLAACTDDAVVVVVVEGSVPTYQLELKIQLFVQ